MARSISEIVKEQRSFRNTIKRTIFSLPLVGSRLHRRSVETELDKVLDQYAPQIQEAKAQGDIEKYEELRALENHEASEYGDRLRAMDTRELVRRARRQLVAIPVKDWDQEDGNWQMGHFGDEFLTQDEFNRLTKEVRDAERETDKLRFQKFSVYISIAAFVFSVSNLFYSAYRASDQRDVIDKKIDAIEKRIDAVQPQIAELSATTSTLRQVVLSEIKSAQRPGKIGERRKTR